MSGPRIFISHSAQKIPAKIALNRIVESLDSLGCEVFVDKNILPGSIWRDEIYTSIGRCHGAVILFADKDALNSAWVYAETAALALRRWLSRDFRLIPVLGTGLKPDVLRERRLEPFDLSRLQVVTYERPEDATLRINRQFESLLTKVSDTPLDLLTAYVERLIPHDPFLLERALHEACAGSDLSNLDDLPSAVARSFFHIGLDAFRAVIERLAGGMEKSGVERVTEIVLPFSISPEAVVPLARAALAPQQQRIPLLKAHNDLTSKIYIRRAASHYPLRWMVIPVTGAGGERTAEAIVSEIRHGFRSTDPYLESYDDAYIDTRIAAAARSQPVIVIVPGSVRGATIAEVQKRYPYCTFFIVAPHGTAGTGQQYVGLNVVELPAALDAAKEDHLFDQFLALRRLTLNMT